MLLVLSINLIHSAQSNFHKNLFACNIICMFSQASNFTWSFILQMTFDFPWNLKQATRLPCRITFALVVVWPLNSLL